MKDHRGFDDIVSWAADVSGAWCCHDPTVIPVEGASLRTCGSAFLQLLQHLRGDPPGELPDGAGPFEDFERREREALDRRR